MKILISSHAFAPSMGGIETVSGLFAREFSKLGHEVTVVTKTAGDGDEGFPFAVVRRPSLRRLFGLVKWCDVFWQNNLSLRSAWPAFVWRRPLVITHQGSYCRRPSGLDLGLRIKHAVANRTTGVSISQAVARCFKAPSLVIPNPYDARTFFVTSASTGRQDMVFVGRLVSEKGLDILLESLARLVARGVHPQLTIVGSGPELAGMQELANRLHIHEHVKFTGAKTASEVAEILNHHRILVVPSRSEEPFGVVALEGIACGCVVVGSSGGGLPEAIGPCGMTFPNGDINALADVLEKLLADSGECQRLTVQAPQHLARFKPTLIANEYLNLFRSKLP